MSNQELVLYFVKKCLFDCKEDITHNDLETACFEEIFDIANKHSIANIVALGIKKLGISLPDSIEKAFKRSLKMSGYLYEMQTNDLKIISDELEKFKIPHIALKGSRLRNFYPKPYLRTCSDIDFLYDSTIEKITSLLTSMHYEFSLRDGNTLVFKKAPFIYVEMHSCLYEDSHKINERFDNIWSHLIKRDGTDYTYDMSEEDFYVYMLTHLANHFYGGGSGIRSIIDIYIYNLNIGDRIDREKVRNRLSALNMLKFEERICHLGKVWFENADTDEFDNDLNTFVFDSGTYGTYKNMNALEFANSENLDAEKRGLKRELLFPKLEHMRTRYPILIKAPLLLPFMWIARFFKIFTPRRKNALNQIRIYNSINENYNEFLSGIFKSLGI